MDGIDDDSDDSDIQEISIVSAPRSRGPSPPLPPPKRRKSSPQIDPIPSYTPTPLHILEQRARASNSNISSLSPGFNQYPTYTPTPILASTDSWTPSYSHDNDYTPLLGPSPSVVGRRTVRQTANQTTSRKTRSNSSSVQTPRRSAHTNSATALPPVSSALAQAVARRRNSQTDKDGGPTTLDRATATRSVASALINPLLTESYAEEPIMWSPQLPSQIESVKGEKGNSTAETEEDVARYKSPRITKQRIAHKPATIALNKKNLQPRAPLGVAKKVPVVLRMKYLDVIISEYLNTGHKEEESYQEALKEEQALATRAANKSIYINLVAGLKKRIREKAGISTLPQDQDPKYVDGNKVVSHSDIITGKVTGTFSIERKRKTNDISELNDEELYDKFKRYLVPVEELEAYGYPCPDPDNASLRKVPLSKDGQKQRLRPRLASTYTCERCAKVYRVHSNGMPLSTTSKCIYHPGHLWNERINRALEKRYSCCKGDQAAGGCSSNPYHVHNGELELANFEGYVETKVKPERDLNKHGIYALDCEMCYTTYGLELTRITVINRKAEVVYEKLVKPTNPLLDYNTKYSGIKEGDLDYITTSLADVQQDLLELFSSRTILIGHSLDSDMKALKMFHKCFIDTAQLFPHKKGLPFKRALRTLMVEYLRVIIQEDVGHDSKEDASAALRLVMWKAKTDVPVKST